MPEPKTPHEMLDALSVEFPKTAIKSRQGDGKRLSYVDGTTIMRRLNAATNGEWNFEIIDQDIRPFGQTRNGNDRLLLTARGRLTIPGLGSREHMGVQVVNAESGGEDLWKGAITDALKKAATLFGVGLELYGPDYEAGEIENTPAPRPAPQRQPTPITPPAPRPPLIKKAVANNPYRGQPANLDQSVVDEYITMIRKAGTRDEWTHLVSIAKGQEEIAVRECYWVLLAEHAPDIPHLKGVLDHATLAGDLTERVAQAINYRSADAA